MELRHLRYFIVTAEQLNFSKAAKMLYISQPGLSKNINELERLLGVELFDRFSGKLALTQAGEYLLREAKKLISEADRVMEEVQIIDCSNKRLCTIAIEDKVAAIWGSEYVHSVQKLKEKYPLWTIRIYSTDIDEISAQLKDKRVDFGIVMHHDIKQLRQPCFRRLGHDRMGVVCHKNRLSARASDFETIKALCSKSVLYYADYTPHVRTHYQSICQELDLVTKNTCVVEPNITKVLSLLQEDIVFLMPRRLSQSQLTEDFIFTEFPGSAADLGVYAVWKETGKEALIHDFCAAFKEISGEP